MNRVLMSLTFAMVTTMLVSVGLNIAESVERRLGRIDVVDLDGEQAPAGAACVYRRIGNSLLPVIAADGRHVCMGESI